MSYTERAFATTDEAEIKRIREYIAALKAELARVRGLDPVEFWWDEIGRVQRKIDAILNFPKTVRPPEQMAQLATLEGELNGVLDSLDALTAQRTAMMEAWYRDLADVRYTLTNYTRYLTYRLRVINVTLNNYLIPEFEYYYNRSWPSWPLPPGPSVDYHKQYGDYESWNQYWSYFWGHIAKFDDGVFDPVNHADYTGMSDGGGVNATWDFAQSLGFQGDNNPNNGSPWPPPTAIGVYSNPPDPQPCVPALYAMGADYATRVPDMSYWEAQVDAIANNPPDTSAVDAQIVTAQQEINRIEAEIDAVLALPITSGLTEAQKDELTRLFAERADCILRYRLAREPKRGGKMHTDPTAWEDITGDVIWGQTDFTQMARTGPGNFTVTLKGSHPEFRAGEEIRLEVDGLRSFGGWVTSVERGYFFPDATAPKTVLIGTDYNILFDRLAVRNYPFEYSASLTRSRMMMGAYRNWPDFPQGTLDADMIDTVFGEYLLPDLPIGFDYTGGVDAVTTPAPVSPWAMPTAGSALRVFMQSVSQITSAVWCIDATMQLQYHDREEISAPYPLTDGLGGISSRNLKITSDISNMSNDVIVWGTLGKTVEGEIMVWHEQGDLGFWERYWLGKIRTAQLALNKLLAIPVSRRTAKQKKAITTYRNRITTYKARLEDARARSWDPLSGLPRPANAIVNSIDTWGRWQRVEFREDIHHQEWLEMRGHSILTRYDEPIIRASATIWDPGYQAGQVVNVKSSEHGVDVDLVIRQLRITFTVAKEPHDGFFYALPQYDLEMGLDPEAPWNIYDYLPYPGEGTPGVGGDVSGG